MLFNSVEFWAFFCVVFCLYYLVRPRYQWMVLLAASFAFYLYGGPRLAVFLLFSILLTWAAARKMGENNRRTADVLKARRQELSREERKALQEKNARANRKWLLLAAAGNLGVLCILKYIGFLAGNLNGLFALLSVNARVPVVSFALPVGLSFYTFQSLGYVIDVSRGLYEPERNLARYALFVSFFPQILQGPIGRFPQMKEELFRERTFDSHEIGEGMKLVVWGLFKKLVIADQIGRAVDACFGDYTSYPGPGIFLGAVCFTIQLYTDFSGYMDMAQGISQMLQIRIFRNFRNPFFSRSIQEFWQRWHISLGSWFKDYVFYPILKSGFFVSLGKKARSLWGKKAGKDITTYAGMFCLWFLIGAWHGADWKFIVGSGLLQWFYIVSGRILEPVCSRIKRKLGIRKAGTADDPRWYQRFQMVRTFLLFAFSMIFFRAATMADGLAMVRLLFSGGSLMPLARLVYQNFGSLFCACVGLCVLFPAEAAQNRGISIRERISKMNARARFVLYAAALASILIFGTYGITNPSQFIYFQF